MTAKEKIVQYLDFKGISKNQFYVKTGLSQGFLNSGNTIGVDKAKIIIRNYPDINLDWLVLDKGEMLRNVEQSGQVREPQVLYRTKKHLNSGEVEGTPMYSLPVSAGDNYNILPSSKSLEGYVNIPGVKVEAYFPVIGCSMEPIVYQGSYVGVNKVDIWNDNPIINPSKIFFIITSDERMIKHIEYNNGDEHINCLSPNYPSFKLPVTEIKALYRVDVIIKFP